MSWRALCLAALGAACAPAGEATLPVLDDGSAAGTLVLATDPAIGEPIAAWVVAGPQLIVREAELEAWPIMLLYAESPDELRLPVGALTHAPEATGRLRRPNAAHRRAADGWMTEPTLVESERLKRLRFTPLPDDPCAEGRGCLELRDPMEPEEPLYCARSCEAFEIAPPEPPEPPRVACGAGFERVEARLGISYCDATIADCARSTRAEPGGTCAPIGAPCGADDYAPPPAGLIAFVHANAAPRGDGSRALPWSLGDALARAADGATLLLSKGDHAVTTLRLGDRTLLGACAGDTTVTATTVTVTGQAGLRELSLDLTNLRVEAPAQLAVRGTQVQFVGAGPSATIADGASVTFDDVRLESVVALSIASRGDIEARALATTRVGFDLVGGRSVLTRSVLRTDATVIDVHGDAGLTLHECVVRGGFAGIDVEGTTATITDSVIYGAEFAVGVVADAARVSLSNSALTTAEGPTANAFFAAQRATFALRDVVMLDGASLLQGVTGSMVRVACLGGGTDCLSLEASTLTATDLTLDLVPHEVRADPGPSVLRLGGTSSASIQRVRITGTFEFGITVHRELDRPPPRARFWDVEVIGGENAGIWLEGSGQAATRVDFERIRVRDARGTGIGFEDSLLEASLVDVSIEGVRNASPDALRRCMKDNTVAGCSGVGIYVNFPIRHRVQFTRFLVQDYESSALDLDSMLDFRATQGRIGTGRVGILSFLGRDNDNALSQVENLASEPEFRK